MAEAYSEYSAEKKYISDLLDNPAESDDAEKAEILYEVTDKRDKHTKVYKRADGTYTALVSQTPLHFMKDGVWTDIDNSLVLENGVLTNAYNPFNVTLPERITSNSQITLESNGEEISFAVKDIVASDSKVDDVETEIAEEFEGAVANTKSGVTYEDVADDTDIQYVVLPNAIKENIIVSDAESVKSSYSFDIDIGDLSYRLNADNSIEIIDSDNNVKFTIPAPVMTDSKFAFSYDIGVSITDNNNGTITLVYSPSKEWASASDRVYPITIDPAIVCNDYDGWVEDTFVFNDTTNASSANSTGYSEALALVANRSEIVNEVTESYSGEVYTRINNDLFSSFGDGIVFTNVQYVFSGAVRDGSVGIKEITSSCDFETVTYNTKPTLDTSVVDFYTGASSIGNQVSELEIVNFDITTLFNSWINGETNNGFAVAALDDSATAILMLNGELNFFGSHTYSTTLIADYVYSAGYDESYNYHSQELGKAGTAYINDFTRELFLKRDDIAISGNIMPVSVSFMYNSGINEYFSYNESVNGNYVTPAEVYGNNWITNYNRLIYLNLISSDAGLLYANYLTENGNIISFAVEMQLDENDNEVIVFVEEGNSSGYSMELLETPSNYNGSYCDYIKITRPDGTAERFDENGRLISVTKTVMTDETPNYQTITVNYVSDLSNDNNFLAIDYITDGVGRKYQFVYDSVSGLLASIQCYDSDNAVIKAANNSTAMCNTYTYSAQSNLISVSFNGVDKFTYDYDTQSNNLTQIELGNQYKVVYTYNNGSNTISQMKEYAKPSVNETYAEGSTINIVQQSPYQVQFSNGDNYSIVEQFNADGTLFATIDNRGNYSLGSKVSTNLLPNNSFENGLSSWTVSGITSNDITTDTADSATHSLDITASILSNKEISQIVAVPDGDVYTFSAYIKSDEVDVDNKLTIKIEAVDNQNNLFNSNTRTIAATATEYTRYSVQLPYTLDEFVAVKVTIGLDNATGNFNIDTLQLEAGNGIGNYDYLINGALELYDGSVSSWSTSGTYSSGTASILGNNVNYIEFDNDASSAASKSISQTVAINGKKDDIVTFGCWAKGNVANNGENTTVTRMTETEEISLNNKSDRIAGIKFEYTYTDERNEQQTETITKSINGCVQDWQFLSDSVILKGNSDTITVSLLLEKTTGNISFAKAFLSKDKYSFDILEEPEPLTIEGGYHEANVFYSGDGEDDPIGEESYCICGEHCAYGVGCPCTCTSEEECNCSECQKLFDIIFDSFGNISSIIVKGIEFNSLITMLNSRTYADNGNYLVSETDENGNTKQFLYNQANGYLKAVTDARGNDTSYTYYADGNIHRISTYFGSFLSINGNTLIPNSMNTEYDYNEIDKTIRIKHNNFFYGIDYNGFGQVTRLYVKSLLSTTSNDLVSYEYYNHLHSNKLKKITYCNGDYTNYNYDNNDNIISIINCDVDNNKTLKHLFYYDSMGNKVFESNEIDNDLIRRVYYNSNSVEIYTDDNLEYYTAFDENNNAYEIINGIKYTSTETEGVHSDITGGTTYSASVNSDEGSVSISKSNDAIGRNKQRTISVSNTEGSNNTDYTTITTEYTFKDDNQMCSSQVETYTNNFYFGSDIVPNNLTNSIKYSYEYDANGNIIEENSIDENNIETLRYRYTYDEANQLTRVDDNVAHKTTKYTYDIGGNRQSVKEYNFTLTDSLGSSTESISYTYDALLTGTWKWLDRLNKYGGCEITYDNAGNPTYYNGCSLTWAGKQLTNFKIMLNKELKFKYDSNGQRIQKSYQTMMPLESSYTVDYFWKDGRISTESCYYSTKTLENNIVHTTWHRVDAKLCYAFDDITPCAIMFNNKTYLFAKDLLGNVTEVIDSQTGESLVSYSYNAFGEVTALFNENTSDEEQLLIKMLCPFTYRGYYYDFESYLYCLQSRYYNPHWGRFLNVDDTSILLSSTGTIKGANLFTYCGNNPINYVDHTGFKEEKDTSAELVTILLLLLPYVSNTYFETTKNKDQTITISIKTSEYGFFQNLYAAKKINKELTYLVVSLIAVGFTRKYDRYFLFSIDCVSYEIQWHFDKYVITRNIPTDYVFDPSASTMFYNSLVGFGLWANKHLMDIDIAENGVFSDQAKTFHYKEGILPLYRKTDADPYYDRNTGERIKEKKVDESNQEWKTKLKEVGRIRR